LEIKQDHTPLKPSKLDQVSVLPSKEIIPRNILWSNAYVDENVTIDPIVNVMKLAKAVLHIGPNEDTSSFERHD
jgi:hypothetical protein